MSEGSAGGRRYDDDEVARILKRATEIRSESTAVSRSRPQDGLTLRELEEIAGEAGIDVAHLRQAALELEAGVTAEGWGQRYVGGPWTLVREATVEGELDDDGFQAMVSAVQTTLTEPGFPSLVGRTMSWKNEAQKAGGRSTMITVTSRRGTTTIRVEENLQRLGFRATLIAADASRPDWWDGTPFDRILLDAPCSASGVIRRHPDIKLLRQPEDIPRLVALQATILESLWPMLKPGGMLVYATCSILPQENAGQLANFLANHDDAKERPIEAKWGQVADVGRQILPDQDRMDGFYYACIEKGDAAS